MSASWYPQSESVVPGVCGHSHARSVDSDSAEKVLATYTNTRRTGTDGTRSNQSYKHDDACFGREKKEVLVKWRHANLAATPQRKN